MRHPPVASEMMSLPKPIKLLSVLFFVYFLGWGMASPFLPIYFNSILGNFAAVGFVIGLLPLFSVFWALGLGSVVDRVPKKHLMVGVLVLYLPMSYFLLSLQNLSHFVYFRLYHSFTATGLWVGAESYLRKHSPKGKESQAVALWDAAVGGAVVFGAAIGGLLMTWFGFSFLWVISVFIAVALVMSFFLPNRERSKSVHLRWNFLRKELKDFFSSRGLPQLAGFEFFYVFAVAFVAMILPLFLLEIGASFIEIGLITSLFFLPVIAEPFFSTFKRKGFLVLISCLAVALSFLVMFFLNSVIPVFLVSIVLGIFLAAITPVIGGHKTKLMPRKKIGELSAVMFAIKGLAGGLGPVTAGVIAQFYGLRYVFLLGFVIFLGLSAVSARLRF